MPYREFHKQMNTRHEVGSKERKCWLPFTGLYGVIYQKIQLFLATAVKMSSPPQLLRNLQGITMHLTGCCTVQYNICKYKHLIHYVGCCPLSWVHLKNTMFWELDAFPLTQFRGGGERTLLGLLGASHNH